jgi:mycoredoxin
MVLRHVAVVERTRTMLTMYSTPWCGYCHRLKSQFDREGIAYEVIDIEQDPASADFVMSVNGGNQTVPTIRIVPADGAAEIVMTNPSIVQVKAALAGADNPA